MSNYTPYKNHLLAKNSDAYQLLSVANKLTGTEREVALKKLDQHLREVDRRYKELVK